MYDDSSLIKYDGSVAYLYLYDNATTSFFGGSAPMELYIDPANTGWAKMYGTLDRFDPYGPYGEGHIYGNWLANGDPFSINLVGHGAYSHIEFIPEPASALLIGLGWAFVRLRKRRG